MDQSHSDSAERRHHPRIKKNYLLKFYNKNIPSQVFEPSQIEDISRGGIRFSSTHHFTEGLELVIELRTPFTPDYVGLEGKILQSHERAKGLIYSNRLQFTYVSSQAKGILEKIEVNNAREKGWK